MTEWLTDENGNKCSPEYFGSEEAAQKALDSLVGCKNCVNCSYCSYCSRCSGCSYCSGCSDCSGCSYCLDCLDCLDCSDCSRCSGCSYCSRCSDCSRCSRCSYCSRCSDCSHTARLYKKENIQAAPTEDGQVGAPVIPKIENIHATVLAAVSVKDALNMRSWHTCETTHCRAGWVVHLAGDAGKALEKFHNTELAAMLIYAESSPDLPVSPARFHETNDVAMADMVRMAELEAAQA